MSKSTKDGGESEEKKIADENAGGADDTIENDLDTEEKGKQGDEDGEHSEFDSGDLLDSLEKEEGKESKSTVSEEERKAEKKTQAAQFKLGVTVHSNTVQKILSENPEMELDEALEKIPVNFRTYIKNAITGETETKKVEKDKGEQLSSEDAAKKVIADQEGRNLFSKIVDENGLSKEEAEAFAKDSLRRRKLGHSYVDSVLDASARSGYGTRAAIKKAKKEGELRGLRGSPPEGERPSKKERDDKLTPAQIEMAKACGNDPKKTYGKEA